MPKKFGFIVVLFLSFLFLAKPVFAQTSTNPCDAAGIAGILKSAEVGICQTTTGMDENTCAVIQCALNQMSNPSKDTNQWWNPSLGQFSNKVFNSAPDEIFGERYTYAQVNWVVDSLFTMMLPRANKMSDIVDMITIFKQLQTGQIPSSLQPMASVLDFPFNHPVASFKTEAQNTLAKFQVVQPVEAQGLGYTKLNTSGGVHTLWTATRNMAYLIAIVLLLATAFMIMFRTKVNPQVVVSLQIVIPKLVISLILITFSLSIVGFVMDMIYVSLAAIVGLLQLTGVSTSLGGNINLLLTAQTSLISNLFLWWYIVFAIIVIILMMILQSVALPFGGVIFMVLAILLGFFVWAIISMVRIFITLIHAYLNLIILTVTGPLQIMMDILPTGHKSGFVPWFKCVVGNASVFVITGVLALAAELFFGIGHGSQSMFGGSNFGLTFYGVNPGFSLPFISSNGDWLLGNITKIGDSGQGLLLGVFFLPMAFFSMMPGLMTSVRNMLCKTDDPSGEITKMIDGMVKQLTGRGAKQAQRNDYKTSMYDVGGSYGDWDIVGEIGKKILPRQESKIKGPSEN